MNLIRPTLAFLFLAGIAITVTGCTSNTSMQTSNFDLSPMVATRVASAQPSFGVGDELGWMMFSQVAMAPEASPTYEVLATVDSAPVVSELGLWLEQYLSMAR